MLTDEHRYQLWQRFGLGELDLMELRTARRIIVQYATAIAAAGDVVQAIDAIDRVLSGRVLEEPNDD